MINLGLENLDELTKRIRKEEEIDEANVKSMLPIIQSSSKPSQEPITKSLKNYNAVKNPHDKIKDYRLSSNKNSSGVLMSIFSKIWTELKILWDFL